MKIETKATLTFTITSENPPHTTAVEFIKAAAKHNRSECTHAACPMEHGAVENRATQFVVTDGDEDDLLTFAGNIRICMNMIGVLMSDGDE
jgi:hypothetical protein